MRLTGVKPLDRMVEGLPNHAYIQLVADDSVPVAVIALHFLKGAKVPVYINLRGVVCMDDVVAILGSDGVMVNEMDGEKVLDIVEHITKECLSDMVVVDDLPSIVSSEERDGVGDEIETMALINRRMIRIKQNCIKNGIPIIWINQFRQGVGGVRVWGGKVVNRKMSITLTCVHRAKIDAINIGNNFGDEFTIRVVSSDYRYGNRRTFFGIFGNKIDNAYWLFKEAQRYRIITKVDSGFLFGKKQYAAPELVGLLKDEAMFQALFERVCHEDKTRNLYGRTSGR